jgi:hypothetical protein
MLTISTILFESTSKNKRSPPVPDYSEKVIPAREKIHDLSQKKGIRKSNKKTKIVMS